MSEESSDPKDQRSDRPTAIIADDEALMRANLRDQLAIAWPELQIVAEATDGDEAVALVAKHRPDIAFLDIRMPGRTGLDAALAINAAADGDADDADAGESDRRDDDDGGAGDRRDDDDYRRGGRSETNDISGNTEGRDRGDAGSDAYRTTIVFVTAYEQHALQAFEAGAVDYLLKPIDPDRLAQTVDRLRRNIRQPARSQPATQAREGIEGLLADLRRSIKPVEARYMKWIKATVGRDLRLLNVDDVVYFQSDTKYTRVVLAQSEALIRTPMKELLAGLDPEEFWQIHRGTLVNVAAIASISRDGPEKQSVHLKGRNEKLPVSRQFFHLFRQM